MMVSWTNVFSGGKVRHGRRGRIVNTEPTGSADGLYVDNILFFTLLHEVIWGSSEITKVKYEIAPVS